MRDGTNDVKAVFSKSFCPYCKATKSLLDQEGAKYFAIELDQVCMFSPQLREQEEGKRLMMGIDDGADIQAALKEINGQSSVPNIYINKKHIGGNSDLQARKGELKQLLQDAGAI